MENNKWSEPEKRSGAYFKNIRTASLSVSIIKGMKTTTRR